MLECTPHSVFSWNYSVSGLQLGTAELTFEALSDRGAIAIDGVRFDIRKQGWLDASWTLERDGNTVAIAKRCGMLGRSFDLTHAGAVLLLKPQTVLVRDYHLLLGDTVVGTIEPEHPLTRRARVQCDATVAEMVQLFSFWLVAMVWRSTSDASPT
ncbi:hypothetical protein [Lysobacter enzymogenes]|uniref:hypothetical protein n=1 Tax=Lysobacter enzymogenes TaxID=69 RepID=UPI00099DF839|nr:hypothetical protein [Lysobacter enzymogenes]UZW61933.1 hypothetical protein BV903_006420 [Lysobacter enzymogenes]